MIGGNAEERKAGKQSLAHLAELGAWNLCEQELQPAAPSDYPKMLVEMYHRFRAREFELVRERDMWERMYDRMQPAVEKNAHEFYQQQLHGFVDRAKDELQQQHEAQMKCFDRMQRRWDEPGRPWPPVAWPDSELRGRSPRPSTHACVW